MVNRRLAFWETLARALPRTASMDSLFAYAKFFRVHGRVPSRGRDLFNDRLFYCKVSPEALNPLRTYSTDKEFVKSLVRAEVGEEHVVPTLAVLRTDEQIDDFEFPDNFCAKPTHASGVVQIVRASEPDRNAMKSWLSLNHYKKSRERNYLHLTPKVIVEPIIFDEDDITDFRIFCVDGKAKLIALDIGKYSNYQRAFYNTDWQKQPYSLGYPKYESEVAKPYCLPQMIEAAETLSRRLNFVRVDFYTNGTDFYVGELTHCHASASQVFIPKAAEELASSTLFT